MSVAIRSGHVRPVSVIVLTMIIISSVAAITAVTGMDTGENLAPPPRKEVWGNGPIVNRSIVEITLYEGFEQMVSPDSVIMTGSGWPTDVFYDPNHQWREGGKKNFDLPVGNETFTAAYPGGFGDRIKIDFIHYFQDVNFGYTTMTCLDENFNSIIYDDLTGKDHFTITLFAENRSGISKAELRLSILNVNDAPRKTSDEDSYSIAFPEDTSFRGLNEKHMDPLEIFSDTADPFDVLTFRIEPANGLAQHIETELEPNGTGLRFIPEENWSCPYLPPNQRLSGDNRKDWDKYFAKFIFNVSDPSGARVSDYNSKFFVYVIPVNDEPTMVELGNVTFKEDTKVKIAYGGSDPDTDYEQRIWFNHDLTTVVYHQTGTQLEFDDAANYRYDMNTGVCEFTCDNDLVGVYNITAWIRELYPAIIFHLWLRGLKQV